MFTDFSTRRIRTAAELVVSMALTSLMLHARNPAEPGFPSGIRLAAKARGETAIAALGNRLPEVAAFHGKSPQQLRKIFQTDNSLWVDPEGQLFYACELQCAHHAPAKPAEISAAASLCLSAALSASAAESLAVSESRRRRDSSRAASREEPVVFFFCACV